MKLHPVSSSAIKAVGYDAARRELHIKFASGATYAYHDVSPEEHEELMGADSIGGHLATKIKPGRDFRKL